jgi:hypothetical protein
MAKKQQDNSPAPAALPAYKVVKREKDRWWEVRDPEDELVCDGLQARRGRGGAPARNVSQEPPTAAVGKSAAVAAPFRAYSGTTPGRAPVGLRTPLYRPINGTCSFVLYD